MMDMKSDISESAQKKVRDEEFAKFLDDPTTKFILSFVPEGRDADAVKTILRAAFDKGFSCGGGFFVADLLKHMTAAERDRRR